MKTKYLILFIIICFFSCKNLTKSSQIIIGYDKEYYNSFDGILTKKILINFLKENNYKNYKFKSLNSDVLLKNIKNGKIDFAIINLYNNSQYNYENSYKSKNLFSNAVYFIMNEEESKTFSYPDSLITNKVGLVYQSECSKFITKSFGELTNFLYYKNIENLLTEFNEKKINILVLNREEYYKNILTLPNTFLFFVEDNKTYGNILFSNKKYLDLFNLYMEKRKNKEHEWNYLLLPDIKMRNF